MKIFEIITLKQHHHDAGKITENVWSIEKKNIVCLQRVCALFLKFWGTVNHSNKVFLTMCGVPSTDKIIYCQNTVRAKKLHLPPALFNSAVYYFTHRRVYYPNIKFCSPRCSLLIWKHFHKTEETWHILWDLRKQNINIKRYLQKTQTRLSGLKHLKSESYSESS